MQQSEDHLEFVVSVGSGDRTRGVQRRSGRGGHLAG